MGAPIEEGGYSAAVRWRVPGDAVEDDRRVACLDEVTVADLSVSASRGRIQNYYGRRQSRDLS